MSILLFGATVQTVAPTSTMVSVPDGTFPMGCDTSRLSERPRHLVTVGAFAIDVTEVTARDYATCVAAGMCKPSGIRDPRRADEAALCNDAATRPAHPINCVDWNDARAFCSWAGKRLPTEEEWEYAARGTDDRAYPWGDAAPSASTLNAFGSETTTPVGSFDAGASPFGAKDMAGNVWEWTSSTWSDDYASPREYDLAVVRGGGFGSASPSLVRATVRGSHRASFRDAHLGFRCAR